LQERVSQTVRPQPSPTHAPAGSWVESRLARARSPYHLPYTSPASLPYTTYLPTQAAYPIPPTYPATPPQQPTLYHTPVSQVAYPTPAPPDSLPYTPTTTHPKSPTLSPPASLPYTSRPRVPGRPPTAYPIPALRRLSSASQSVARSFVCRPGHLPYLSPAPNQPTLSHTHSHQQRHTQPAYPIPHQRQPHTPSRSPEATPQAAYPTPQHTQPPEDLAAHLRPSSPTLHLPPGSDLRRSHHQHNHLLPVRPARRRTPASSRWEI
jgi:hypothetical protein